MNILKNPIFKLNFPVGLSLFVDILALVISFLTNFRIVIIVFSISCLYWVFLVGYRIHTYKKIDPKDSQKTVFYYSELKRKWFTILMFLPFIVFLIIISVPPSNEFVRTALRTFTPTPSATPTAICPVCPNTITPIAPTNTLTPTSSPTLTSTLTISSTNAVSQKEFVGNCISDRWSFFPNVNAPPSEEGCLDLSKWGMVAKDDALKIFIYPETQFINGIYIPLPKGDVQIKFRLDIAEIEASNVDKETILYFGLVDPTTNDPEGKFLFYKKPQINIPLMLLYGKSININRDFIVSNTVESKEVVISINKNDLYVDFQGNVFINNRLNEIPLSSKYQYFWIGYKVPIGGKLSVEITDFQIIQK